MTPDHEVKLRSWKGKRFIPFTSKEWMVYQSQVSRNLQPIAKQNEVKVVHIQHRFVFLFLDLILVWRRCSVSQVVADEMRWPMIKWPLVQPAHEASRRVQK